VFKWLKKDNNLYSPIGGRCLDIVSCIDNTFASKMLGDGYLIMPNESTVCSPCNGEIITIFPTKHALGIVMENGQEIMVHIGVDTVKLNGKDFESFVRVGDRIKVGNPLIKFDNKYLSSNEINMAVLVVMIGVNGGNYTKERVDETVKSGDRIINYRIQK